MQIDPTVALTSVSALLGALIGGGASVATAVYTQRHQNRLQRVSAELTKRETVYAEFVTNASNLLLTAYTRDEVQLSTEAERLVGLINRMRLFAPHEIIAGADAVIKSIIEISLKPGVDVRQLAQESLSKRLDPDPLLAFSSICRADLDNIQRTMT